MRWGMVANSPPESDPPDRLDEALGRVGRVDDGEAHRVALGAALGMFVAFTPTIGFQTIIVLALASMLRANKLVGLPLVWISNPVTIPPIFYAAYSLGRVILRWPSLDRLWWMALTEPPEGWWTATVFYWSKAAEIAAPLWLGSILIGAVAGVVTYLVLFRRLYSRRLNALWKAGRTSQA